MAVGNQPQLSAVNAALGNYATNLRDLCRSIANFAEWANSEGQAGLVAIGFSSADATTFLNMVSYMNTISGVYFGTATQGTQFNFDNALSILWGGY